MYEFKDKRVLVAGGTGLIGIPLVRMLIDEGAEVRVASLDSPALCHPDAAFYQRDLLELNQCREMCDNADYVFNLLCVKGSPAAVAARPATVFEQNLLFNMNLLRASRECGAEGFCFASSVAVYAPAEVLCEDDVWKTFPSEHDRYAGWAKRMGELHLEAYRREYGMKNLTVVRPGNIYGPYDNFDPRNSMVIPSLIRRFMSGENPVVIWGDGSQERDFLYADDAARAILCVARHAPPYPVNIGSGIGVAVRDIVEMIRRNVREFRVPDVWYDTSKSTGDRKRVLDISRLKALGFAPSVSLEKGIQLTIQWYAKNRDCVSKRHNAFRNK